MKNMNKLFLMSALLLAANSTSYLAGTTCGKNKIMRLKLDNDTNEALTAHFEKPLDDDKTHQDVKANTSETVVVDSTWLNADVVVTWKNADGKEKDKDTVRFTETGQELTSSANDDQTDGHADKLR